MSLTPLLTADEIVDRAGCRQQQWLKLRLLAALILLLLLASAASFRS